ncbi:MAG TPA: cobalamin biosynthesis protein [Acidimicrobiia bacterium]|nr:cobalamin biosynthesis protein [Acidimicrobiia bacterium]
MTEARPRDAGYVVGIGASGAASEAEVDDLVRGALAEADVSMAAVRAVATVQARVDHPAIRALPWPTVGYPVDTLAAVEVSEPSELVARATGTPSVAEAAALAAAGDGARLVVPKRRSRHATVAVARSAAFNPAFDATFDPTSDPQSEPIFDDPEDDHGPS